jgi:hypothetical protein
VGRSLTGPLRDARRLPCTRWYAPYRGLRVRRWVLGFVHRSRTILHRPVPTHQVRIRNFCIAVCTSTSPRRPRPGTPPPPPPPPPLHPPQRCRRVRAAPSTRRGPACCKCRPPPGQPQSAAGTMGSSCAADFDRYWRSLARHEPEKKWATLPQAGSTTSFPSAHPAGLTRTVKPTVPYRVLLS